MLELYEKWQASGKSKTAFAESHGIRPTTFYYWTRKFEKLSEPVHSPGFHQISVDGPPPSKSQGELMAAVQYPCGTRVELYSSFQALNSSYVQLLKALAG